MEIALALHCVLLPALQMLPAVGPLRRLQRHVQGNDVRLDNKTEQRVTL